MIGWASQQVLQTGRNNMGSLHFCNWFRYLWPPHFLRRMVAWDTPDVGEVVQARGTIPALASFQRHGLDGLDLWPSWIRSETVSRLLCRIVDIKFGCSNSASMCEPWPWNVLWIALEITCCYSTSMCQLSSTEKGGRNPFVIVLGIQMTSKCFWCMRNWHVAFL